MIRRLNYVVLVLGLIAGTEAFANVSVAMNMTAEKGVGKSVGTIEISETPYGLLFTPHLQGLTPGIHGFHIHQNASCDQNGMAAGGHLDPSNTGKHLGPYNEAGHVGDLPVVVVNVERSASLPVLAPRLKHLSEIKNHTLMIHEGGDNYSDQPVKLGGGGTRMVCGVIN